MMKNKKLPHVSHNVEIGIMILLGGLLLYGFFFGLPLIMPYLLEKAFNIENNPKIRKQSQWQSQLQ